MKRSNIASIVIIAVIATMAAYFAGNALLGDPNDERVSVSYMDMIEPGIAQPDPEVFNPTAVNPTVEVYVGDCPTGQTWDADAKKCVDNTPAPTPETETPAEPEEPEEPVEPEEPATPVDEGE